MSASFREQVRDRQRLTGTFFKTASYQSVEVLAGSGLDFIVLDAEHAPFDRNQLDVCLMAARAGVYGRTPMLAHFEVSNRESVLARA